MSRSALPSLAFAALATTLFGSTLSAQNLRIGLCGAASSSNTSCQWVDVQNRLIATGRFERVDIINAVTATPSVAQLLPYSGEQCADRVEVDALVLRSVRERAGRDEPDVVQAAFAHDAYVLPDAGDRAVPEARLEHEGRLAEAARVHAAPGDLDRAGEPVRPRECPVPVQFVPLRRAGPHQRPRPL